MSHCPEPVDMLLPRGPCGCNEVEDFRWEIALDSWVGPTFLTRGRQECQSQRKKV